MPSLQHRGMRLLGFVARGFWHYAFALGCLLALGGDRPSQAAAGSIAGKVPPRPQREFRGAWIATVANLDWPSKPGLPTAQQKTELLAIFDRAVELKLNVLILQVRPACDAFYASDLEPWSEFLTGEMGKAPEPYDDPLAFAVTEAHHRGLELHAWFNPFRVRAPNAKTGLANNYLSLTHPQWVRTYGGQLWLDPGLKAVHEYAARVIGDVVRRYDIDGVHLDDYFYPYPEKNGAGQLLDFPDDASWQQYQSAGGRLGRNDWRRKNIDDFIEGLYRQIKKEKRWVKLGVSPFGIWRPGFPRQIKGLDAFEHLYADSRKWLGQGWVDYFAPQLYWAIDGPDHSYPALLEWWAAQNPKSRHVFPGNDLTKIGGLWRSTEVIKQVRLTRKQPGTSGNVFWSMASLMRNPDRVADSLSRDLYNQAALVPASPWLAKNPPAKPRLKMEPSNESSPGKVSWVNPGNEEVSWWVFQTLGLNGKWTTAIFPRERTSASLPASHSNKFPQLLALTAIDRCGMASPTTLLETKQALALLTAAKE